MLDALAEQKKLTGDNKHIFLTQEGRRMTPDHFRKEVWMPALEKAGLKYRPPIQMRHTFATMMLSAREDIGWVQNMLGHSSLQMSFQRFYAWIPKDTRSDGQAFFRYAKSAEGETSIAPGNEAVENAKTGEECTNYCTTGRIPEKKKGLGMP